MGILSRVRGAFALKGTDVLSGRSVRFPFLPNRLPDLIRDFWALAFSEIHGGVPRRVWDVFAKRRRAVCAVAASTRGVIEPILPCVVLLLGSQPIRSPATSEPT